MSYRTRNQVIVRCAQFMALWTRPVTVTDAAHAIGVTPRTVYRYLNAFEEAHIPIVRDELGRYRILSERRGL